MSIGQPNRYTRSTLRNAVWKRIRNDNPPRCHWCQAPLASRSEMTVDHVVPIADGGSASDPENCVPACRPCNTRRSSIKGRIKLSASDKVILDIWGEEWNLWEERPTVHGWTIYLGKPPNIRHGLKVIVTRPLADHISTNRMLPIPQLGLPVSDGVVKRVRKLLGIDRHSDARQWWEDRIEDLATMTGAQFADTHGVSTGAVSQWRQSVVGPRVRPAHWWRDPEVISILRNPKLPRTTKAEMMRVSVGTVGRLQWLSRVLDGLPMDRYSIIARISAAKRGRANPHGHITIRAAQAARWKQQDQPPMIEDWQAAIIEEAAPLHIAVPDIAEATGLSDSIVAAWINHITGTAP